MLLDPFEEQLDLPAQPVQLAHGLRRKARVVGQERDALSVLVPDHYAAQRGWVALLGVVDLQRADLIAQDLGVRSVHRLRVATLEAQPALGADQEEAAGLVQRMKAGEVHVAAIEQVERAGLWRQHVQHVDLVHLAVADVNEARDRAAHVQQRVQLDVSRYRVMLRMSRCAARLLLTRMIMSSA